MEPISYYLGFSVLLLTMLCAGKQLGSTLRCVFQKYTIQSDVYHKSLKSPCEHISVWKLNKAHAKWDGLVSTSVTALIACFVFKLATHTPFSLWLVFFIVCINALVHIVQNIALSKTSITRPTHVTFWVVWSRYNVMSYILITAISTVFVYILHPNFDGTWSTIAPMLHFIITLIMLALGHSFIVHTVYEDYQNNSSSNAYKVHALVFSNVFAVTVISGWVFSYFFKPHPQALIYTLITGCTLALTAMLINLFKHVHWKSSAPKQPYFVQKTSAVATGILFMAMSIILTH